jgi:hypothetical protein
MSSRIREYCHLFNGTRRIVATIRISLNRMERLHAGALAIIRCEWDGSKERQPSAASYPEFNGVLTHVVEQTGQRLLLVFEPPGEPSVAELWLYEPGEPRRPAETLRNPCGKPLSEGFFGATRWEEGV